MEYALIETIHYREFVDTVNSNLQQGWELHGDTALVSDPAAPGRVVYAQAMTRTAAKQPSHNGVG